VSITLIDEVSASNTTGTSIAATLPLGAPTDGDVLMYAIRTNDASYTLPAGYSILVTNLNAIEGDLIEVGWKQASGDSDTLTLNDFAGNTKQLYFGRYEFTNDVAAAGPTATTERVASASAISSGTTAAMTGQNQLAIAVFACRASISGVSADNSFVMEDTALATFSSGVAVRIYDDGGGQQAQTDFNWTTAGVCWALVGTISGEDDAEAITMMGQACL
jgi:hypothetical protein